MTISYISHISHNIVIYNTLRTQIKTKHRHKCRRMYHGRLTPALSVSIKDVITDKVLLALSTVRIASSWCPPAVQYMIKCIIFTNRDRCLQVSHRYTNARSKLSRLFLLPLLVFSCVPSIHTILVQIIPLSRVKYH